MRSLSWLNTFKHAQIGFIQQFVNVLDDYQYNIKLLVGLTHLFFYNLNKLIKMKASTCKNEGTLLVQQHHININTHSTVQLHHMTQYNHQIFNLLQQKSYEAKQSICHNIERPNHHKIETNNQRQPQQFVITKSINHNFQKHSIVTIKKLTRNIAAGFGNSRLDTIAHQMWNIFLSSGIKSKRILVILFGKANLEDEKYKELLRSCFFGELCNFEQLTIQLAQESLRNRVSQLLTEDRVRKYISDNRNIKHREAFFYYFMNFVENIKRGPLLHFRINSTTSKLIIQKAKSSINVNLFQKISKRRKSAH